MPANIYDLIIIGGGPAGLSTGIYASRARLNCVLFEKMVTGGQMLLTASVENYPGFPKPTSGGQLALDMTEQAKSFGLNIKAEEVVKVVLDDKKNHVFNIETASGSAYSALSIIIASGAVWKKLSVPGESSLNGRGVSYCATCDGPMFKGKDVIVIGGGDKALEEALYLAKLANSVKLIHRRDRFRAVKEIQERVLENEKIVPIYDSIVTEICGTDRVGSVIIENIKSGKKESLSCSGIFIFIGITPNSETLKGLVNTDSKGFILTDAEAKTSQDGIYACGDVIKKSLYQIANAVGEGATAAFQAQKYVEVLKGDSYP